MKKQDITQELSSTWGVNGITLKGKVDAIAQYLNINFGIDNNSMLLDEPTIKAFSRGNTVVGKPTRKYANHSWVKAIKVGETIEKQFATLKEIRSAQQAVGNYNRSHGTFIVTRRLRDGSGITVGRIK